MLLLALWGAHNICFKFFRLNKLLGDVVISQGGVVPYIAPEVRVALTCRPLLVANSFVVAPAKQDIKGQEGRVARSLRLQPYSFYLPFFYWFCSLDVF